MAKKTNWKKPFLPPKSKKALLEKDSSSNKNLPKNDFEPIDQNEVTKVVLINEKNIFKSFTFWFALASLSISIYTILDSNNQLREQNRKWRAINLGRISIAETKFYVFREVGWDEMHRDTLAGAQNPPTGGDANVVDIENMLVAYDSTTKHNVPYTSAISLKELIDQLHKRQIFDFSHLSFQNYYKPVITIQNVGQTPCTVDSILLSGIMADVTKVKILNGWEMKKFYITNFNLDPGQKFPISTLEFNTERFTPLPRFRFKFSVYYTDIEGGKDSINNLINFNGVEFFITNNVQQ